MVGSDDLFYIFDYNKNDMSKEKTQTTSRGERSKKFKMPKFPPALVIIFGVLLFVVLLSWIPHKGWVDTGNPIFYFNQEGLFMADKLNPTNIQGIQLGFWDYPATDWMGWNNIQDDDFTITLQLTTAGVKKLDKLLATHTMLLDKDIATIIAEVTMNGIVFNNVVLGLEGDWSSSAINYSGLSFTAISGEHEAEVIFDKVFVPQKLTINTAGDEIFTTNILSGSITSLTGTSLSEKEPFIFNPEPIANDWYNFFGSNYYMGDSQGRYGLLNIPFVLLAGFFKAAGILLFLVCIGAFIKVMLDSGALEAGTASLVNKLKGKELALIPILFVLFCILGTSAGMQEAVLGLIPLIIPFLILAGFDSMTGLLIIVMGTTSGIAASVLNPFSVGAMSAALETGGPIDPIELSNGIIIRVITFTAFATFGSLFVTAYAHRSRKGKEFVLEPDMYEKNIQWAQETLGETQATHTGLTRKQAIGIIIFAGTFLIMLFALLPWLNWFPGLKTNPGWEAFSSLLFAKALFGHWYFVQLAFLFLIAGLILGKVFGMKQKETNKSLAKGALGMYVICMILTTSRAIALVLTYSGLTTGMVAMMFSGGQGGFGGIGLAWVLFPMFTFLALFIPSTSGLAGITGPLIAPIIWLMAQGATDASGAALDPNQMFIVYGCIVLAVYPLAQGLVNMCSPTCGILVAQVKLARVEFGKAFKILIFGAFGTALIGMLIITASIPIMVAGVDLASAGESLPIILG